ncbi:hypothetical protein SMICM304S_03983 [Streptomyces microflavus]
MAGVVVRCGEQTGQFVGDRSQLGPGRVAGEGGDLEQGGAAPDGQQLGVEQAGDDPADRVGRCGLGEQFGQGRTEVERALGELVRAGGRLAPGLGPLALGVDQQVGLGDVLGGVRESEAGVLVGRGVVGAQPFHQQPGHPQLDGGIADRLLLERVGLQVEEERAEALRPQGRGGVGGDTEGGYALGEGERFGQGQPGQLLGGEAAPDTGGHQRVLERLVGVVVQARM